MQHPIYPLAPFTAEVQHLIPRMDQKTVSLHFKVAKITQQRGVFLFAVHDLSVIYWLVRQEALIRGARF
jgi:hypothetical protein